MKRLSLMFFAVAVIGFAFLGVSQVQATDTDTSMIQVTVTMGDVISISLTNAEWTITDLVVPDSVVVKDDIVATVGNVQTILSAKGVDGTGGWLMAPSVAEDKFMVEATAPTPGVINATSFTTISGTLASYSNDTAIHLQYTAPSGDTQGADIAHPFSIIIKATKATG
jgi:hypothetical protein